MGGGGGGDNGAASAAQAEVARKQGLRTKINQLYGYDDPGAAPTREQFMTAVPGQMVADPANGESMAMSPGSTSFDQAGYDKALADYAAAGNTDPIAKAARDAEAKAEGDLTTANQDYYGDQLKHATDIAFRNNRFALADRGTLGGSAQIDTERELSRDNTLGATRIADQVAQSIAQLRNANEGERLSATQLVNQGAGVDAVNSAQAGLQRSLQNVQAQGKANITGDLFSGGANTVAAANNGFNPALLAQYQNRLSSFTNPTSGNARVTPTGGAF